MLKRFPDNFSSFTRSESIAKRDLEITQCDLIPAPIKEAKQRSGCLGKMIAGPSREQRDQCCGKKKADPFKAVPGSLPV